MNRTGMLMAVVCWGALHSAQAATLVNWGGASVAADVAFNSSGPLSMGGFSGGNPLELIGNGVGSGYSGVPLYGMVSWQFSGSDGIYGGIDDSGGSDRIEIKRYNANIGAVVLWRQDGFLNGLSSGNVSFDSASTVNFTLPSVIGFDPGRIVIRSNGNYYISDTAPMSATSSASLTALNWRVYNPATNINDLSGAVTNILSGGLIENVTEIGFYTYSASTSANAFRVSGFTVTAIPEPSSLVLLGLGLTGLYFLRRRNSRN